MWSLKLKKSWYLCRRALLSTQINHGESKLTEKLEEETKYQLSSANVIRCKTDSCRKIGARMSMRRYLSCSKQASRYKYWSVTLLLKFTGTPDMTTLLSAIPVHFCNSTIARTSSGRMRKEPLLPVLFSNRNSWKPLLTVPNQMWKHHTTFFHELLHCAPRPANRPSAACSGCASQ